MCISPVAIGWSEAVPTSLSGPCGKCWQCRKQRIDDFVGRCLIEAEDADHVAFATLTYRPDYDRDGLAVPRADGADVSVTPLHAQRFVRALRRRGYRVRYLIAGEYGERKGRAHFHAILFFRGPCPDWGAGRRIWDDVWPHGHMWIEWQPEARRMRYVAKYCGAEIGTAGGAGLTRWHSLSKKPLLGAAWIRRHAAAQRETGLWPRSVAYRAPGDPPGMRRYLTGAARREWLLARDDGVALSRLAPTMANMLNRARQWLWRKTRDLNLVEEPWAPRPVPSYVWRARARELRASVTLDPSGLLGTVVAPDGSRRPWEGLTMSEADLAPGEHIEPTYPHAPPLVACDTDEAMIWEAWRHQVTSALEEARLWDHCAELASAAEQALDGERPSDPLERQSERERRRAWGDGTWQGPWRPVPGYPLPMIGMSATMSSMSSSGPVIGPWQLVVPQGDPSPYPRDSDLRSALSVACATGYLSRWPEIASEIGSLCGMDCNGRLPPQYGLLLSRRVMSALVSLTPAILAWYVEHRRRGLATRLGPA